MMELDKNQLSDEDWKELEETINRDKQLYTQADLDAAHREMKERCIGYLRYKQKWYKKYANDLRERSPQYALVSSELVAFIDKAITAIENLEVEG
jgi:hypothetical protein